MFLIPHAAPRFQRDVFDFESLKRIIIFNITEGFYDLRKTKSLDYQQSLLILFVCC